MNHHCITFFNTPTLKCQTILHLLLCLIKAQVKDDAPWVNTAWKISSDESNRKKKKQKGTGQLYRISTYLHWHTHMNIQRSVIFGRMKTNMLIASETPSLCCFSLCKNLFSPWSFIEHGKMLIKPALSQSKFCYLVMWRIMCSFPGFICDLNRKSWAPCQQLRYSCECCIDFMERERLTNCMWWCTWSLKWFTYVLLTGTASVS